jgi:CDGSH-type Zn-finger protein
MKVTIIANGPICLDTKDAVAIQRAGVSEEKTGPLFLCRCGQSATKPFCDGTHRKIKFEAPSAELEIG